MNPDEVQARVRLSALLFRSAMPRLAKALPTPPRPEEKERLYAGVERAAWEMDERLLDGSEDDDAWDEKVLADPAVRARVAALVADVAKARAGPP